MMKYNWWKMIKIQKSFLNYITTVSDVDTIPIFKIFRGQFDHHSTEEDKIFGVRKQHCFKLFLIRRTEKSLLRLNWQHWSSCSWMKMFKNFREQPSCFFFCHIPPLLNASNTSVISMNVTYSCCFAPGFSLGAVGEQEPYPLCSCWL